jgi:hypothetical protein
MAYKIAATRGYGLWLANPTHKWIDNAKWKGIGFGTGYFS